MTIVYPLDSYLPHRVISLRNDICIVQGTSRVLEGKKNVEGTFWGGNAHWKAHFKQLLTKQQRRDLAWIKRNLGDWQYERQLRLYRRTLVEACAKPVVNE